MSKPVIFFSHSSKDQKILIKLKDALIEKTGGSIDIFLSSDGQSIPLGTNWIHKIEESLTSSKLLLIFLSPSSIRSTWVPFEAGYVYRNKKTRVVPVGILGINLSHLSAPLSLLQGFNISSADGLNNIIALINELFDFSHNESFNKDDYNTIFDISNSSSNSSSLVSLPYVQDIKYIKLIWDLDKHYQLKHEEFLREFSRVMEKNHLEYQRSLFQLTAFGLYVTFDDIYGKHSNKATITIDPIQLKKSFYILDSICDAFSDRIRDPWGFYIFIFFSDTLIKVIDYTKMTARLQDSGIKLLPDQRCKLDDMEIKWVVNSDTPIGEHLRITYTGKKFSQIKLNKLLSILFEREILIPRH